MPGSVRTLSLCPLLSAVALLMLVSSIGTAAAADPAEAKPPAVGDKAADFELKGLDGKPVKLSEVNARGPVVLLVLRGYPGYQCPACSRQVANFVAQGRKLKDAKATVLMVYPGPADNLETRAEEFLAQKSLPEGFHLLTDPDHTFTDAWQLRWRAPQETAYPSTFVIDRDGTIRYAKISKTHGGRAPSGEVLEALTKLDKPS